MANFTPKSLIQGNQLMLFNTSGHSYAYATSHNLSVQGETQDISSKDHGIWGASAVSRYSWSISSDNLATDQYDELYAAMITGEPQEIKFGLKAENDPEKTVADGDYEYWTLDTSKTYYQGKAIITNLEINAENGSIANYTIELQGVGKLEQVTPA